MRIEVTYPEGHGQQYIPVRIGEHNLETGELHVWKLSARQMACLSRES